MSLLKKLFNKTKKEKMQNSLQIYDAGIKNGEAMMPKQERLETCLDMHPEGEYILTEKGVCVCNPVVISHEGAPVCDSSCRNMPEKVAKSLEDIKKDQETTI